MQGSSSVCQDAGDLTSKLMHLCSDVPEAHVSQEFLDRFDFARRETPGAIMNVRDGYFIALTGTYYGAWSQICIKHEASPKEDRIGGEMSRILFIDDQPFFLTYYQNLLTAKGFQVLTARSGEEGLEETAKAQPDLIILDMEMPGLDGIEVCSMLKANEATQQIPIVILTATLDPKLNEKAFRAGAKATVLKSMNPDRLLNLLHVILTTEWGTPNEES